MKFIKFLHPKYLLIFLVKIYQFIISPFLNIFCGCKCRFTPSCSQYMLQAIEKKGLIKGFFAGIYRILRCNPFNKNYGLDPVK